MPAHKPRLRRGQLSRSGAGGQLGNNRGQCGSRRERRQGGRDSGRQVSAVQRRPSGEAGHGEGRQHACSAGSLFKLRPAPPTAALVAAVCSKAATQAAPSKQLGCPPLAGRGAAGASVVAALQLRLLLVLVVGVPARNTRVEMHHF